MPVFVDDDLDRGYRNVTGRASLEFAATDALTFRARALARRGPHRIFGADVLAIRRTRPPRRISRTASIRSKPNTASPDGFGVRATVEPRARRHRPAAGRLRPGGIRLRAHAPHQRRRAGRSRADRHALRSASACSAATRTRARSPSARCSTKTRVVTQAFVQDQFDDRHAHLAARARRRRSRNLRQRAHVERGIRRRVRHRHARHALGRQGVPRAGQHRPLRLRRQSGSRPRGLASRWSSRCARS